jgi:hypothetical protein
MNKQYIVALTADERAELLALLLNRGVAPAHEPTGRASCSWPAKAAPTELTGLPGSGPR